MGKMLPSPLSGGDVRNRLFEAGPAIYRAYTAESAGEVRELFARNLIPELVERGYVPRTWITDQQIPGYDLVIQHERIAPITYAHEWTFTMLKDAALFVLDLREYLRARGYDLVDAHCDNVTFHGGRPIWLDLGSIVRPSTPGVWLAGRRFFQSFVYPLQLWSRLGEYVGRRLLLGGDYRPREAAWLGTSWWARRLSPAGLRRACQVMDNYAAAAGVSPDHLRERLGRSGLWRGFAGVLPGPAARLLQAASAGRLPFQGHNHAQLVRRIQAIDRRGYLTRWEEYHTGVRREVATFAEYPRFRRVLQVLKELAPATVTEIGTNQGALAEIILAEVKPDRMTCLDIDDGALDRYYRRNRDQQERRVTHAVLDVMRPFAVLPKLPAAERFKSEALVALAVTHHMVMGQCNSMEYLFERLAAFTTRWILVEYMPHGFHTEPGHPPPPENYSPARFEAAFRQHFDVVSIETLEPTRVLYCGKLRASTAPAP